MLCSRYSRTEYILCRCIQLVGGAEQTGGNVLKGRFINKIHSNRLDVFCETGRQTADWRQLDHRMEMEVSLEVDMDVHKGGLPKSATLQCYLIGNNSPKYELP